MNDDLLKREQLSALADGEASHPHIQAALAYAESGEGQQAWRMYHLIGDVLRSDELSPARPPDARFLEGLRERIAREPVPLAPGPLPAPPRPPLASAPTRATRRWPAPAAMAAGLAGVMVVGSAVVLMRPDASAPPKRVPT